MKNMGLSVNTFKEGKNRFGLWVGRWIKGLLSLFKKRSFLKSVSNFFSSCLANTVTFHNSTEIREPCMESFGSGLTTVGYFDQRFFSLNE